MNNSFEVFETLIGFYTFMEGDNQFYFCKNGEEFVFQEINGSESLSFNIQNVKVWNNGEGVTIGNRSFEGTITVWKVREQKWIPVPISLSTTEWFEYNLDKDEHVYYSRSLTREERRWYIERYRIMNRPKFQKN